MSNCGCKRDLDPAGIWDYHNLIGAKVRIKSMPVSNFSKGVFGDLTIADIYFRISTDGKAITVIRLKECPELFFTWKDLEVVEVSHVAQALCGTFKSGGSISGAINDTSDGQES